MNHKFLPIAILLVVSACQKEPDESVLDDVNAIASAFVDGYYAHYPEEVYEVGYPDAPLDRFGDHSAASRAAWDAKVDGWLAALNEIDVAALEGTPEATTHAFTRDRLQAIVDRRVCQMHGWNISPTWTGWQYSVISTLAIQPVDTHEERQAALARASDIGRFVVTEIENLRGGLDRGYSAPTSNVAAVIEQLTSLIDTATGESPFFDPATRTDDEAFRSAYQDIYDNRVRPALVAYRDYLVNDYKGRDLIGVAANPDGEECYAASVRYWSSLSMDAMAIHRVGLSEMARIQTEMLTIAKNHFDTEDLSGLFEQLRTDPRYTFESEEHMLDYIKAAVERGRDAVPNWFGNVPDVDVVVKPAPAYEKDSGGGFYAAGSADGSRPGTYLVGTYNPTRISIAGQESTAFHESWPGHHMQVTLALMNESLHPVLRYMFISGSVEGWALYTERLADEMGLYSGELDRLGMLSNEAYRAARLVVDPGIHVLGWTRDEAIEYMMENTAEGYDAVSGEIDRYAAVPGQATSYLLGSLEIQRLRRHAERALGDRFNIREFHDRLLADGGVTLPMLATTTDAWIAEVLSDADR